MDYENWFPNGMFPVFLAKLVRVPHMWMWRLSRRHMREAFQHETESVICQARDVRPSSSGKKLFCSFERHKVGFKDCSGQSTETGIRMIDLKGLSSFSVINPNKTSQPNTQTWNQLLSIIIHKMWREGCNSIWRLCRWKPLSHTFVKLLTREGAQLADVIFSSHSR